MDTLLYFKHRGEANSAMHPLPLHHINVGLLQRWRKGLKFRFKDFFANTKRGLLHIW